MTKNINYLQFRAARNVLNLGVREIASLLKVSKATISKADLGKTRDFFFKHSPALLSFFEKNYITFPNDFSIRYNHSDIYIQNTDTLTRFQLKCARSILNISQLELANLIKVHRGIISKAEANKNFNLVEFSNITLNEELKKIFLSSNIEFPDPFFIFFKKYVDK